MSKTYPNNGDWYWLREDGTLFSSARIATVPATDEAYLAWAADGSHPTLYPRDEAGEESAAELGAALAPIGLFAGLEAYAAAKRWVFETGGVVVTIGGEDVRVSTARGDDRAALQSTYSAIKDGLRADGATFKFADGKPRPVSNAEMEPAVLAAFAHVQGAFDKEAAIVAAIEAGTITNTAAVDAAFAAE